MAGDHVVGQVLAQERFQFAQQLYTCRFTFVLPDQVGYQVCAGHVLLYGYGSLAHVRVVEQA